MAATLVVAAISVCRRTPASVVAGVLLLSVYAARRVFVGLMGLDATQAYQAELATAASMAAAFAYSHSRTRTWWMLVLAVFYTLLTLGHYQEARSHTRDDLRAADLWLNLVNAAQLLLVGTWPILERLWKAATETITNSIVWNSLGELRRDHIAWVRYSKRRHRGGGRREGAGGPASRQTTDGA